MTLTAVDGLIEALREVANLDGLHVLISNDHVDKGTPPAFSAWLIGLINTERMRRETDQPETDYAILEFSDLNVVDLYAIAAMTLSITEASIMCGDPTRMQFALRLQQLAVGSLGLRALRLAAHLAKRLDSE